MIDYVGNGDASGGEDGLKGGTVVLATILMEPGSCEWLGLKCLVRVLMAPCSIAAVMISSAGSWTAEVSLDVMSFISVTSRKGLQLLDEQNREVWAPLLPGQLADEPTQARVRCLVSGPGVVTLIYNGGSAKSNSSCKFSVRALGYGDDVSNMAVQQVGDSYYADAIYTVPEGLVNETTHAISFGGSYTPTGGQAVTFETQSLLLQRPPVILVHGLWSQSNTWSSAGADGLLAAAGFNVSNPFDYRGTNASHFSTNAALLVNHIAQTLTNMRNSQIAIARVDIAGHSMGGDISRTMVAQCPAYMVNTFGKGLIHRFVTLGTPHWGSPLANLLWSWHNGISGGAVDQLASLAKHPIDQGAIEDLQEGSNALQSMGPTNVASFALIGDINPANLIDLPIDTFVYNICRFFRFSPSGVDTSSLTAFMTSVMSNTANDGIVTGPSQAGGLNSQYTQLFEGVFHTQEPGSADMGTAATNLLSGDVDVFASGFPQPASLSPGVLKQLGLRAKSTPSYVRALDSAPLITITQPAPGATFHSNDQMTITAVPVAGVNVQAVLFTISDGSGNSALVQQAPFTTTFTIANEFVGTLTYTAAARDNAGNVSISTGTATVESPATLQSISVTPSPLTFSSIGATQQLTVLGNYSDGVQRDITSPDVGTTYSPNDTSIVDVSATGSATAQGAGNTVMQIYNGSVETQVVAQITPQAPNVLSVSPSTVAPGTTTTTFTIQGLYLGGASSILFMNGSQFDPQITAGELQVDTLGQTLTTTLTVGASAAQGPRTVVVTTPGGSSSAVAGTGNQFLVQVQNGSLTVTITPATALNAGAMWAVDGGSWQTSGATVANLSVGIHTASFKGIQGWTTPSSQTFNISNGRTTTLTGTYTPFFAAIFTASITSGNAPLKVHFTNSSVGSFKKCLWHFGDGKTSKIWNPNHTYSKAGTFTVTLTLTGAKGTTTCTQPGCIRVYAVPKHKKK